MEERKKTNQESVWRYIIWHTKESQYTKESKKARLNYVRKDLIKGDYFKKKKGRNKATIEKEMNKEMNGVK